MLEVFLLDLILSGDNALVIALACRGLPPEQLKRAVLIGTSGAILLRVLLTTLASWLLSVPGLKLIGAVLLLMIAIRLLTEEAANEEGEAVTGAALPTMSSAVFTVLTADLIMSMDNVLGLAAVAQGSVFYLLLGLLLSVPVLMFASVQISRLLQRQPRLIASGAALLGYVAGDIAVGDPLVVGWVNSQSPALNQMVPLLCAVFVVLQARIIHRQREKVPRPLFIRQLVVKAQAMEVPVIAPHVEVLPHVVSTVEADANPVRQTRRFRAPGGWVTVLAGLAGIFLLGGLLYSAVGALANSLLPAAQKDSAYSCTEASATLYFRPGGSAVRLVTGGGEATGYVNYGKILWENAQTAAKALHLTLPDEIEKTSANVVTLRGGSFAQIPCTRNL
ncbi:TerC family protein [Pseudomonas sp. MWU12-3091]|uniref:TerC family protein n=1 Tax=Pseudomonas sp. MWU12-3091 TaxID=2929053 RepID=UPI00200C3771|nr:TerC family protein [Pseudomonas sp. MWU12-3091]